MRISIATTLMWFLAAAAGCRRDVPRTPESTLNSPRLETEAQALMLDVDRMGAELGWPKEVLRNVRQGMRGRLLAAGMSESRVEQWVASAALTNQAKTTDKEEPKR